MKGRPPLPYDVLSIDVGISPGTGGIPGVSQHATPVKPVSKCAPAGSQRKTELMYWPCTTRLAGKSVDGCPWTSKKAGTRVNGLGLRGGGRLLAGTGRERRESVTTVVTATFSRGGSVKD